MSELFDITNFDSYKEDNRREVKRANGGLPIALWESYSAMANTYGGVIILGIKELDDRRWKTTGLKYADKERLLDDLWNQAHNPQKVSVRAELFAKEYKDDKIIYTMASGAELWCNIYAKYMYFYGNAVDSFFQYTVGNFFHGPFEITDKEVPFVLQVSGRQSTVG